MPLATITAAFTIAIGVTVLIGWASGWAALTTLIPASFSTKPDSAIALVLAGVSLFAQSRVPSKLSRGVAKLASCAVIGVSATTLLWHTHGPGHHGWIHPSASSMAPVTALALAMVGMALSVTTRRSNTYALLAECALVASFAISLIVIIGYVYGIPDFYLTIGLSSVAPLTAVGLGTISIGALCVEPRINLMRVFTADEMGGRIARRIWLPLLCGVVLYGAMLEWLEKRDVMTATTAELVFVLGMLFAVALAIWTSSRTLNATHVRLRHRDRLYAALSATNLSIVRLKEPSALYEQVCQIAVEKAGFSAAWIGLVGADGALRQTAQAGSEATAEARRLAQRTVETSAPSINNELPVDNPAADHGVISEGAFPLIRKGTVFGVLVVEASETGFFLQEEIDLLTEMATDLSFAIETLESEALRLATEHALHESHQRLQLATAAANIGFWDWDLTSNQVYFSPEWRAQLGLAPEEMDSTPAAMRARIHPEDREAVVNRVSQYLTSGNGEGYTSEFRLQHADGSYRWIHSRGRSFHSESGKAVRLAGWHVDITARKHAEEAAQEREARLQLIIENLSEGLLTADLQGNLLSWNQAALDMHGFKTEKGLLRSLPHFGDLFQMLTPDGRVLDHTQYPLARVIRGEVLRDIELRVRRLDISWERVFSYGGTVVRSDGNPPVALLTITDVTERTVAESAIRSSEARFRELADHVDEVFWISDPQKRSMLYVSPAYEKIWGRTCDALYEDSENWLHAVHLEDRERVRQAAKEKQVRGDYDERYRILRPDGSLRWIRDRAFPVRGSDGVVYRIVGTAQDVTKAKLAELRRSLHHSITSVFAEARTVSEAAERVVSLIGRTMEWPVGELWLIDRPTGKLVCAEVWHSGREYTAFVTQTRDLTFTAGEGIPGRVWRDQYPLWVPDLEAEASFVRKVEANLAGLRSAFATPITTRDEIVGVMAFFAPQIREPDEEVKTLALNLGSQFGQFIQRTRIEEQFRQSQKMDAIGQLAGGVAHDFNNVLTVIKAYPQLIALTPNLSAETHDWLQQISTAADRAAGLTRQLLAFSRKQVMQIQRVNVNEGVESMSNMLRRIIGEDVTLTIECAPELPPVEADLGMLEQVVMNLVVNARDAMPHGGRLQISTYRTRIDTFFARERPKARAGEFVVISVTDTGTGMSPEVMAHIFEPFFTTKPQGKGTGLGLATVYGIAEQHRGWVEAKSQEGEGSTFTVFLPVADAPVASRREQQAATGLARGRETILLVEDEPAVRMLSKVILERLGYRVIEAASGVVAFGLWAEHSDTIDLLLTDMVMPYGVTGRDLAEKMRVQKPSLRVLFTTGYSPAKVADGLNLIEGRNFIQKPYVPEVLSKAVRACLEHPPESIT